MTGKSMTGFQKFYAQDNKVYQDELTRAKGVRYMRFSFLMFFILCVYAALDSLLDEKTKEALRN